MPNSGRSSADMIMNADHLDVNTQAWTTKEHIRQKLEALEMWFYRRKLRISWDHRVTNDETIMMGKIEGKRRVGRRKKSWLRNIREWTGIASVEELFSLARDKERYAELTANLHKNNSSNTVLTAEKDQWLLPKVDRRTTWVSRPAALIRINTSSRFVWNHSSVVGRPQQAHFEIVGIRLGQRNGITMIEMITIGKQHGRIKHIRILKEQSIQVKRKTKRLKISVILCRRSFYDDCVVVIVPPEAASRQEHKTAWTKIGDTAKPRAAAIDGETEAPIHTTSRDKRLKGYASWHGWASRAHACGRGCRYIRRARRVQLELLILFLTGVHPLRENRGHQSGATSQSRNRSKARLSYETEPPQGHQNRRTTNCVRVRMSTWGKGALLVVRLAVDSGGATNVALPVMLDARVHAGCAAKAVVHATKRTPGGLLRNFKIEVRLVVDLFVPSPSMKIERIELHTRITRYQLAGSVLHLVEPYCNHLLVQYAMGGSTGLVPTLPQITGAGNAPAVLIMLKVSMGGGDRLPSGMKFKCCQCLVLNYDSSDQHEEHAMYHIPRSEDIA
ncbi:hypothetical protein MSG28_014063 [Choristoneura fumiferana]|uniref:Uncharacterized protein n=1 Tax=Choristoneura fumiferana TaxID=7141 RepID=A0ACC0JFT6_CHOFU|nr:hypothetical protein MSG28_014063 [Choristoneura fumiferana]